MTPGTYNFNTHYKGDTFGFNDPVEFTLNTDLTGATVKIQFRKLNKQGAVLKEVTNSSGITVSDAANGVFTIDEFEVDWVAGTHYYDIEVTDSSSKVTTYIQGTIKIEQDVTV